jgi:hypothetical protein
MNIFLLRRDVNENKTGKSKPISGEFEKIVGEGGASEPIGYRVEKAPQRTRFPDAKSPSVMKSRFFVTI